MGTESERAASFPFGGGGRARSRSLTVALAPLLAVALSATFAADCVRFREAVGLPCAAYDFGLPGGVAPPPQPPGVCLTPERVELGRRLFYDKRLSRNNNQSCSACHIQALAFSDGRVRALGSTGQTHPRNAQALANIGYFAVLTWSSPELHRLDNQTLIPFFSENTKTTIEELAITGHEATVAARLLAADGYAELFRSAFPGQKVNISTVARALAAFQSTLVSFRSAYDRNALSESAARGKALFFSARTGCSGCHGGPLFNVDANTGTLSYQNVGLYNVNGRGDYPDHALHGPPAARQTQGLHAVAGRGEERGKFRTPSLRNVALTGPYMHDGSVATLAEVVEIFNAGGRNVTHSPFSGDGRRNINRDRRVVPLGLSASERSDLLAFLHALTDECFARDPRFSDPRLPPPELPAHCL